MQADLGPVILRVTGLELTTSSVQNHFNGPKLPSKLMETSGNAGAI